MNQGEITDALLPQVHSMSVLKLCLAVARQSDGGTQKVRLTIPDFAELTGMAKQTILDGLSAALSQGWLERTGTPRSFWYRFRVENLHLEGTESRPKRYENQTLEVRNLDQAPSDARYENQTDTVRNLDRSEKPIPIPDLKDRKNERASVPIDEAFQTVARIVKSEVGFLSRRGFDFDGAVSHWGDLLPDIWEICFRAPNRKPDDLPIYRFEDACNRKFETGLVAKQREASTPVAPPPEAPPFERYEQVLTPGGDVRTIVEIAPNGLVAFEETEELWFARQLRPVRAALA